MRKRKQRDKSYYTVSSHVEFIAQRQSTFDREVRNDYCRVTIEAQNNKLEITEGDNEWWVSAGEARPLVVVRFLYKKDGKQVGPEELPK